MENESTDISRLHNGRFAPGNLGKQKGTSKNKMRDEIRSFIATEWLSFPIWFAALSPKEKIETMLALLPYSVSRLQSVSVTDSTGEDMPQPSVNYHLLSENTLREILEHTTLPSDNEE